MPICVQVVLRDIRMHPAEWPNGVTEVFFRDANSALQWSDCVPRGTPLTDEVLQEMRSRAGQDMLKILEGTKGQAKPSVEAHIDAINRRLDTLDARVKNLVLTVNAGYLKL